MIKHFVLSIICATSFLFFVHGIPAQESTKEEEFDVYVERIQAIAENTLALYAKGLKDEAKSQWQRAYFENFENLEGPIRRGISAKRNRELEGEFSAIRSRIKEGRPYAEVSGSVAALLTQLRETVAQLKGDSARKETPFSLFLYSQLIILREGVEAILIICAILAYLLKTGHADKVKIIYSGCLIAIVASVITAVLLNSIFQVKGASREILEGITMLIAVGVLFCVSFWLIGKVQAQKWQSYIQGKVDRSLTAGSMFALWFTAFLAVYREGAETVLFYQALVSGSAVGGKAATVFAGFITGCLMLAIIFAIMRFGSMRLPLKPFFVATSAILYYMAFVFAGKGVMELIEGGLIESSLIAGAPTLDFLGLYPYWQTVIPQVLLIIAALAGSFVLLRKG